MSKTAIAIVIGLPLWMLSSACDRPEEPPPVEAQAEDALPAPPAAPEGTAPGPDETATKSEKARTDRAHVNLEPTKGHSTVGQIRFHSAGGGVRIEGQIEGLSPGSHGFHVHETGDCDCPAGKCAGGHFAPAGSPHGAPDDEVRHAGDLGNVEADEDGVALVDFRDTVITLEGDDSIVGRAIIVHAGADDLESQPSGNAGSRVACGVIREGPPDEASVS